MEYIENFLHRINVYFLFSPYKFCFKPCLKNRNYCYNLNETVSFSHNYSVMPIGANGGVGGGGGVCVVHQHT